MEKHTRFGSWKQLTVRELLQCEISIEGRIGVIIDFFFNDTTMHVVFDDDTQSVYLMPFDASLIIGKRVKELHFPVTMTRNGVKQKAWIAAENRQDAEIKAKIDYCDATNIQVGSGTHSLRK